MPSPVLPERRPRRARRHFTPAELTAELAQFTAQEVWEQRVRHDNSGRLAQYKPTEELDNAQPSCQFVIPSDAVWPAALADLGPDCPLGLWARSGDRLPQLTASAVAVTGNRNATEQLGLRTATAPPCFPCCHLAAAMTHRITADSAMPPLSGHAPDKALTSPDSSNYVRDKFCCCSESIDSSKLLCGRPSRLSLVGSVLAQRGDRANRCRPPASAQA